MSTHLATRPAVREPARARALLSSQDFALIRTAIAHYLETGPTGPAMAPLGHLYHRLGSAAR